MLASVIVDHLRTRFEGISSVGVAAVFCEWKRQDHLTLENLLASIWCQLAVDKPYWEEVEDLYNLHAKFGTKARHHEIYSLLKQEIETLNSIYIIVDAWDELGEDQHRRRVFLKNLETLATSYQQKVHILVTCRWRECPFKKSVIAQVIASSDDIIQYVGHAISQGLNMSRDISDEVFSDPTRREKIKKNISTKVGGL